jgi:hypothetical protein
MVGNLQLKDLDIRKIDCKNELLRKTTTEIDKFESSFLLPETLKWNNFYNVKVSHIISLLV